MSTIDLLIKIHEAGEPVTAGDLDVPAARLRDLADNQGLLQRPKDRKGNPLVRKTGGRGRPSHLYKLTSKGTKRVKRAVEQAEKAARTPVKPEQAEAIAAA